jgi:hypothetical protein
MEDLCRGGRIIAAGELLTRMETELQEVCQALRTEIGAVNAGE